jgi:hypothetical protein
MRRIRHLLVAVIAAMCASFAWAAPGYARGAPSVTSVTVDGPGISAPLAIRNDTDQQLFALLMSEVNWLATRPGNAPDPEPATLGPRYRLLIRVNEISNQVYDLYPLAAGGPRVFRPADQPSKRKTTAAWFYGRVSMPETLRAAGVPLFLPDAGNGAPGGQGGGGVLEPALVKPTPEKTSLREILGVWQRQMLALAGGALVLLLMIGGAARLVRR